LLNNIYLKIRLMNEERREKRLISEGRLFVLEKADLDLDCLTQVAGLYADVFAPPPWNEFVKCNYCECFHGMETSIGERCDCGGEFGEAYPLEETIDYIKSEADKKGFRMAVYKEAEKILGFSWSYLTTPGELSTRKWKSSGDIRFVLNSLSERSNNQEIRYFSECGVSPNMRGRGLANELASAVTGPETTVYRTNCLSPMMAVTQRLGFVQIMGPDDRESRVFIETG